jgi:hypothetical protein
MTILPITGAADDFPRITEAAADGFIVWTTSDDDPILAAVQAHGVLRTTGLIASSAPDPEELERAVATIEQVTIQASCETRRLVHRKPAECCITCNCRGLFSTMLIYVQHYSAFEEGRVPEPTPAYVAGFKQWLSLDRHVRKGQTGYAILRRSPHGSRHQLRSSR